jgi:hypothetical protein
VQTFVKTACSSILRVLTDSCHRGLDFRRCSRYGL